MLDQENNFYLISLSIPIYQFAGLCMDVLGRSYMLITSRSLRVNWLRKDPVTVVTYCIMSFANPNLLCWSISDLKCHQCSKDYSDIKCNIICLFFPLKAYLLFSGFVMLTKRDTILLKGSTNFSVHFTVQW